MDKFSELRDELKLVFSGRGAGILDALLPFLAYFITNRFLSLTLALVFSAGIALLILLWRLARKQSPGFALGGLGTALLAGLLAYLGDTDGGYYLPGFITGGLTVLACFASVILKRPIAAYSSHLTRHWPLEWYWHEQVRPAYSSVSIIWGVAFALRLTLELIIFFQGNIYTLAIVRFLMGWPFTVLLLVASYLYGQKRLQTLGGPGVEEFKTGARPPWEGQRKGF
jgi:hypothetical protein